MRRDPYRPIDYPPLAVMGQPALGMRRAAKSRVAVRRRQQARSVFRLLATALALALVVAWAQWAITISIRLFGGGL